MALQHFQGLKQIVLLLVFPLISLLVYGQQKEAADNLVQEGVLLQDKGFTDSAMARYQQALELDRDNLAALSEMAYSLLELNNYEMAILYCKRAIKTHPKDQLLRTTYVSYGNALDGMGKPAKAIDIYDDGIKIFPDYFQLYYNKGISQNSLHKTEDALLSFQKSATLNPDHPGSQNAIGHLLFNRNNIPSLLALSRFMVLESSGTRAEQNLENIRKLTNPYVNKTDEGRVSIALNPDLFAPAKKPKPDNFRSAELELTINAALDLDSANVNKTEAEKFIRKFSSLCGYLQENAKNNSGFYWTYYVPYFVEMNDKDFVETFAYIAFSSSKTTDVKDWLSAHKEEVTNFYLWSEKFAWSRSSGN
jgi:hypothetical protein